ncbi:MAG TPA: M14 family zinc carboxypeptidase [Anaerolineales bacterium]|jgi:predicted deacylase
MTGRRLGRLLKGIWMANLVVFLLLAGFFAWFKFPAAVEAISAPPAPVQARIQPLTSARPSVTPRPTPTSRPTITPWPTPSPGPSVTPMGEHPSNMQVIGYSIEKRPQQVFRFGNGPSNKLILAGIHGGWEYNTVQLADQLIAYLNEHPERIPAGTSLYILRDANPDGSARAIGLDGHNNANGVDLNHNWPYQWKTEWSRDVCWNKAPATGGAYGGSELEVQNLIAFIDRLKPQALISYHSAALGIFPGGRPPFAPSINLANAVAAVTNYPYPPINTGCDYSGNLTDWAANTRAIPAIDIELTDHINTDFDQNLKVLQVFLSWRR